MDAVLSSPAMVLSAFPPLAIAVAADSALAFAAPEWLAGPALGLTLPAGARLELSGGALVVISGLS